MILITKKFKKSRNNRLYYKQKYNGMFDNTVEENMCEHDLHTSDKDNFKRLRKRCNQLQN